MGYFDLDPLLETMLDAAPGISDLNLSVGRPPQVEVDGQLRPVSFAGIERLLPYHTGGYPRDCRMGPKCVGAASCRPGRGDHAPTITWRLHEIRPHA